MNEQLLRREVAVDCDNSLTCPICKGNQIHHLDKNDQFNLNKIILNFECINCNKFLSMIMETNSDFNTTEIYWTYTDAGFYKLYFQ